jgi:hypothetical protein
VAENEVPAGNNLHHERVELFTAAMPDRNDRTVTMDSITARLRAAGNFSNAVRESSAPSTSPK